MSINKDWTKEDNFNKFQDSRNRRARQNLSQRVLWASLFIECPRIVGKAFERFKKNLSDEEKELLKTIDLNSGYEKQTANDAAKIEKNKNANIT